MLAGAPTSWREVRQFLEVEEQLNDDWIARTTVRIFRVGQWVTRSPRGRLVRPLWWLAYRFWIQLLLGSDLNPSIELGRGVRFPHGGRQVIIHGRARIGPRATIYHGVTVGVAGGRRPKPVPTIGADVVLSTGAAVLGGVTVGDGAAIGANVVVSTDVPPATHVLQAPGVPHSKPVTLHPERRSNLGRVVAR